MGFAKPIERYLFGNLLTKMHVFMYLKDIIRGAERMNKSRVTEYILAYMQEKGISASEISEQTQVPEEKLHPDYKEPLLAEEFLELCVFLQLSPEAIAKTIRK